VLDVRRYVLPAGVLHRRLLSFDEGGIAAVEPLNKPGVVVADRLDDLEQVKKGVCRVSPDRVTDGRGRSGQRQVAAQETGVEGTYTARTSGTTRRRGGACASCLRRSDSPESEAPSDAGEARTGSVLCSTEHIVVPFTVNQSALNRSPDGHDWSRPGDVGRSRDSPEPPA
jgi:hypothetical protein